MCNWEGFSGDIMDNVLNTQKVVLCLLAQRNSAVHKQVGLHNITDI